MRVTNPDQALQTDEAPPPALKRRRRRWPIMLVLIAATVYAAPWILSINGVAQSVTAQALPWLPPGSDIGKPSLGWMSPVHLAGLRILDDDGRVLLECDHVTSQKSLWQMATSPNFPGGWTLEKPRAYLHVDPTGLSLNPVLERFLARKKRAQPLNFDVTIDNGRIDFLDPAGRTLTTISAVAANYSNAAAAKGLTANATLTEGEHIGSIHLDGKWSLPADPHAIPVAELHGGIDHLPLALFKPWLNANSTIEDVSGGGGLVIEAAMSPSAEGPTDLSLKAGFVPRDAHYRKRNESTQQPVPTSQVAVQGVWDTQDDAVTLRTVTAQSGLLVLQGQGTIQQPRGAAIVDFRTVADQDVSGLLDLLSPPLRKHIVINGLRVRNVAVTGALWPDQFIPRSAGETPPTAATLAGDITWTDARVYGVQATPGAVTAAFQPDGIALWPRNVSVGDGQLVTLPRIRLIDQRQLVAEQGPMLLEVNITPEMCREWLKFVSPIVADATQVQGKVTLIMESGTVPLANPDSAEIAGVVRVHTAQVTPGPLARQAIDSAATLAKIVTQKQPAWANRDMQIELPPQDIAFRMHEGRVYHRGMTFRAGEMAVTTRGSVGLDHSLDMLVEIPLPDAWFDRGSVLKSLKGEVVTIPLQGTLERPQVDGSAITEMGKRMIGAGTAGGLLQNLLERTLDKAAEKDRRRTKDGNAP